MSSTNIRMTILQCAAGFTNVRQQDM